MSVRTESELLFTQHCDSRGVTWRRIEEGGVAAADYEVDLYSGEVIAEVKQLNPNRNDIVRNSEGGSAVGSVLVKRVRNLLSDAYRQIKPYAERGRPCIVVCYNNAGFLNFIDNFTVTSAMFGGMAVYLSLGQDHAIYHSGQGFTGKRKVTRNTCRGLSAVCVLSLKQQRSQLVAYHNPYATHPISPAALSCIADTQFGYEDPHGTDNGQLMAQELPVVAWRDV